MLAFAFKPYLLYARLLSCLVFDIFNFTATFVLCLCRSGKGWKALWQNLVLALALCVLLPKPRDALQRREGVRWLHFFPFLFFSFFVVSVICSKKCLSTSDNSFFVNSLYFSYSECAFCKACS